MKKIVIKITLLAVAFSSFLACESYDFEGEQYKKEVNLLSNSDLIYDRQVASLKEEGDTIYLVAGLSGSTISTESYNVALLESDSLFNAYNKSNYDIDKSRYARMLPKQCYEVPQLEMEIPAGKSSVKFPIQLKNLDVLSPDSTYLLNYKLDTVKTKYYNKDKKEVLLRVYKENEFATTQRNTYYNYTSSFVTTLTLSSPIVRRPTSSNQVFPLGMNSVRMLAGDETFGDYKSALERINARSIKVLVGEKTPENPLARRLTIEPYKTIDVVQMTPIDVYNNTYLINIISTPDGRKTYFKEFRLHYKYRLSANDPYKEVKAILRMEYSPRAENL